MLRDDLIRPSSQQQKDKQQGAGGQPAAKRPRRDAGDAAEATMSSEDIQARVAAVASHCLGHLLEHLRRGKTGELWEALLREVQKRAAAASAGDAESRGAARVVSLLAQSVGHRRGSRVEDYGPLVQMASALVTNPAFERSARASASPDEEEEEEILEAAPGVLVMLRATFSGEVLRFVACLVEGHSKEVGASKGIASLDKAAPAWGPAFALPGPAEVLPFMRRLLSHSETARETARVFGPHIMAAGLRLLQGEASQTEGLVLPLLLDLCRILRPDPFELPPAGAQHVPVLMSCRGSPTGLTKWVTARTEALVRQQGGGDLALLWCCVQLLPYAASDWGLCAGLAAAATAAVSELEGDAALVVLGESMRVQTSATKLSSPKGLEDLADSHVNLLRHHPGSMHVVVGAAAGLEALRQLPGSGGKGRVLAESQLVGLLPLFQDRLSSPAQSLRQAVLRLLCAFDQPLESVGEAPSGQAEALAPPAAKAGPKASKNPCSALRDLLTIESAACTMENGRRAAMLLTNLKVGFEYRKVPEVLIAATVHALLGLLAVRFSVLWAPAVEALGAALEFNSEVAWPIVFRYLMAVQSEFLGGSLRAFDAEEARKAVELRAAPGQLPASVVERFALAQRAASVEAGGGCTDTSTRLGSVLKAMAKAPGSVFEKRAKDWMPLALEYMTPTGFDSPAKGNGEEEEDQDNSEDEEGGTGRKARVGKRRRSEAEERAGGVASTSAPVQPQQQRVGGRQWRLQLRAWLEFLSTMGGIKSLFRSNELQVHIGRLLLDTDTAVQQAAIKCLK